LLRSPETTPDLAFGEVVSGSGRIDAAKGTSAQDGTDRIGTEQAVGCTLSGGGNGGLAWSAAEPAIMRKSEIRRNWRSCA
jgi:hypothetical protein